jgi:hypothetical protein
LKAVRVARLLLLLSVLMFPIAVHAAESDFLYKIDLTPGSFWGYTITGYKGPGGNVIIPPTIGGLPVVGISASAFSLPVFYHLYSITIPDSVTHIDSKAFYYCSDLQSVTIGNGVASIGSEAFSVCTSLTSITIPNSVTNIGNYAFYFSGLTRVAIGNGVKSIGESAFHYCNNLASVTIGNSVASIGDSAFHGCKGLTSITIPASLTFIGGMAFWDCNNLTSVYFIGNAPNADDSDYPGVFGMDYGCTIYYLAGKAGWGSWWGDWAPSHWSQTRPTVAWQPVSAVTIHGGNGTGSYTYQQQVPIAATAPSAGKTFDRWIGDTLYVANATASNTTVTMPAQPVTLTATYKDAYYKLTVINGSAGMVQCTNGTKVAIAAYAAPAGKKFDRWTGSTQYVASVTSAVTTVTMPAQNISVTAAYRIKAMPWLNLLLE